MRIKTLRIKVENDNQDFNFSDFFEGSNTIYTTNTQLIKEGEHYYWYAFFTYKRDVSYIPTFPKKVFPAGFEAEVESFISEKFPQNGAFAGNLRYSMDRLIDCKSIKDIRMIKNFGPKRIADNLSILEELLEIIKKYNPPKE